MALPSACPIFARTGGQGESTVIAVIPVPIPHLDLVGLGGRAVKSLIGATSPMRLCGDGGGH